MQMQKEFLAEIVHQLPEGIIMMDQDRTILYLNDQARAMTGWKLGGKVPYCTYARKERLLMTKIAAF